MMRATDRNEASGLQLITPWRIASPTTAFSKLGVRKLPRAVVTSTFAISNSLHWIEGDATTGSGDDHPLAAVSRLRRDPHAEHGLQRTTGAGRHVTVTPWLPIL